MKKSITVKSPTFDKIDLKIKPLNLYNKKKILKNSIKNQYEKTNPKFPDPSIENAIPKLIDDLFAFIDELDSSEILNDKI